jgi:hypothetical protein
MARGSPARTSIHERNEWLNIITFPLPRYEHTSSSVHSDTGSGSRPATTQLRPRKGVFANSFSSIMSPNIKTFQLRSTSLLMEGVAFDGDTGEWARSECKSFDRQRGDEFRLLMQSCQWYRRTEPRWGQSEGACYVNLKGKTSGWDEGRGG